MTNKVIQFERTEKPIDRPMPYNLEAEQAVLGSLMIDNTAINKIQHILKTGDFYRTEHQIIFDTLLTLFERNEPADTLTMGDELERNGQLQEIGGPAALSELFLSVVTAFNVEHYANIVADYGARRRLIWAGEQITQAAYTNAPVDKIRDKAEKWIGQASVNTRRTIDHVGSALTDAFAQLDQIQNSKSNFFLPCMLHDVERTVEGFARGECTVLGNFTGNGKTAWALQELMDKARRGFSGVYISTEVYAHVLTQRLLSTATQTNLWQVRRGWRQKDVDEGLPYACQDWQTLNARLREGREDIAALPIHIMARVRDSETGRISSPDLSPSGIRASVRAYAEKQPVDFIVVDYLTNLQMPLGKGSSDRSLIVEDGMRTLREMANEVGAALLVLAQYTREASREKKPQLHFLEQSTGIEKGADNVWLGYSPDPDQEHIQSLLIAKGRNMAKGAILDLHFNGAIQRFTDSYIREMEAQEPDYVSDNFTF